MIPVNETWLGRRLGGRYILEEPIGRGGMGEVWKGRHELLETAIAVKFLTQDAPHTPAQRDRFLREAKVTAQLGCRNAVTVFDYGVEEGKPYLVMELLSGETVAQRIARLGRLSPEATINVLVQAGRALTRAHEQGVVHCDFKPENVMIVRENGEDVVKVLDFGIARLRGTLGSGAGVTTGTLGALAGATLTQQGGTPYYMPPEQIRNRSAVAAAADIWALGVFTYQCLVGARPFSGETVEEVLRAVLARQFLPASERNRDLPRDFDLWFELACAYHPEERFRDVDTAIAALDISLAEGPMSREPRESATLPAPATSEPAAVEVPARTGSRATLGIGAVIAATLGLGIIVAYGRAPLESQLKVQPAGGSGDTEAVTASIDTASPTPETSAKPRETAALPAQPTVSSQLPSGADARSAEATRKPRKRTGQPAGPAASTAQQLAAPLADPQVEPPKAASAPAARDRSSPFQLPELGF